MGLGVVMQECGRTLTASPLLSTAVLGTSAILNGGTEQKTDILGQVAAGEMLLGLAWKKDLITAHTARKRPPKSPAMVTRSPVRKLSY